MKMTKATSPEAKEAAGFRRKGPWTEQEDKRLVWFVRLFGERRWDLLAKVSGLQGLNRTGKSCRLRWVNYLHPDLKRGRMSADEERLVVDLHARWGNSWSRIAKSMPGRTDNEIKNYWRTHTRKLHKKTTSPASAAAGTSTTTSMSAATSSSSSSTTNNHVNHGHGNEETASHEQEQAEQLLYTEAMDGHLLWNDAIIDTYTWSMMVAPSSPAWDYCCSDSLWGIDDDEVEYKKMLAVAGAS